MLKREAIFVVEDDEWVRQLIAEVLQDAGYGTVACAGAADLLNALKSVRPLLVTLDLAMPAVDGVELLQMLRQRPDTAAVPVVVVTAAPEEVFQRLRNEVQAVVAKPFHLEHFLGVVDRLLGAGQAAVN